MKKHEVYIDMVPPAVAARIYGVSSECMSKRMECGSLTTYLAHGKKWVSLAECKRVGVGDRKRRLGGKA